MYRSRHKLRKNILSIINGNSKAMSEPQPPMAEILEFFGVFHALTDEVTEASIAAQVSDCCRTHPTMFFVNQIKFLEMGELENQALYDLYSYLNSRSLSHLLRFILPHLVCEVEDAVAILDRVTTAMMFKVHHIIVMKRIFLCLENWEDKITEDVLYGAYIAYINSTHPSLVLDRDTMLALYKSVNYYSLNFDDQKIQKNAVTAVKILEELRESRDNQLNYALEIYRMRKPDINRLIEVNQEVRERYSDTRVLTQQDLKKAFSKVISNIKKVTPLEFLAAAITVRNANDIALENGMLYRKFTQDINIWSKNTRILLVNPPPLFLLKWLEDEDFRNMDCTILCMDALEYDIVSTHLAAITRDKTEAVLFKNWRRRYSEKGTKPVYGNVMIFSTRTLIEDECALWKIMRIYFEYIECNILELFSSTDLEQVRRPFTRAWELDIGTQIPELIILPQDILRSAEPRRKVMMRIIIDCCDTMKIENITRVGKYRLQKDSKRQLLYRHSTDIQRVDKEFVVRSESIRELYSIASTRTWTSRNEPQCIPFTTELQIWYTLTYPEGRTNPPRVEAYFAPLADTKRLAQKKMDRSNRLVNTIKRTSKIKENDIEHWIESVYPFETITERGRSAGGAAAGKKKVRYVRDEAIASCRAIFEDKLISLKLLWYLYPEISETMNKGDYEIFSRLARSELGAFNLGTAKAEDYDQYIRADKESGEESTGQQLMALSHGLNFALEYGHCYQNVLLELADTRVGEERDRLPEIRKALAKKSFTQLEMRKIYEFAVNQIEQEGAMEYLGVLIRLMTGLEANIVSGFCWDDIQSVSDYGFEQLSVCRQVVNNGSDYDGFRKEYSYRAIPCPSKLSRHIDTQRKLVLKKTPGLTKEQREMLPVVTTSANLANSEHRYQLFSPIDLEKISKLAIQAAGIPDQIIQVPSKKKGVIETNLSHYQGDIFRSNFRFYGLQLARLEEGELDYIIGNKPDTTFESYYLDYTNQAVQYAIWMKLTGWCSGIFRQDLRYVEHSMVHGPSIKKTFRPNGIFTAGAEIYLTAEHRNTIEVEMGSQHGLDGTILWEKPSTSTKVGD